MKAILEFNLPEETTEHIWAVNAHRAWAALSEIRHLIRSYRKHGDDDPEIMLTSILDTICDAESWIGE